MKTPQECREKPGFYHVPGLDHHVISKDGRVYNLKTNRFISTKRINSNGYRHVSLRGEPRHVYRIHRLLAKTFLDDPDSDKLDVDHKNGNKLDNSIRNLRWLTRKRNTECAGILGLTDKCRPIQVRNIITGDVEYAVSAAEYARNHNVSHQVTSWRVRHGMHGARVYQDNCQYRYNCNDPWPVDKVMDDAVGRKPLQKSEIRKRVKTRSVEADVRDVFTNQEWHFSSINELAQFLKCGFTSAWKYVCKLEQPLVLRRYQVKPSIVKEWRKLDDDLILEHAKSVCGKPVQCFNPTTGENRVFESNLACATILGIRSNTLFERLKHRNVQADGFMYGWYPLFEGKSIPIEKLEPKCYLNLETPKADVATAQSATTNANA